MVHNDSHSQAGKNILVAFFLNATFSIIEFIGGYLTNSMAIYSDALHDLGDSFALLFSYYSEKLSYKKPDAKFTYGYRRFSVLSAFINGVLLLGGSIFVIYEATLRLNDPEPVKPEGMLLLAIFGIMVNGYAAFKLSKESGINQKMVMFHLLEDILGWVSVFIVSIVLLFRPWYILDSILSILISIVILRGVYKNFLKVGAIFLQKFPDEVKVDKVEQQVRELDSVKDVHAIRGWSIDGSSFYLSLHVSVSETLTMKEVDLLKLEIKNILKKISIKYSTIEFECHKNLDCKF